LNSPLKSAHHSALGADPADSGVPVARFFRSRAPGRTAEGKRHAHGARRLKVCGANFLVSSVTLFLLCGSTFAQKSFMPKMSSGEREKAADELDADYKAATNEIPDQQANDHPPAVPTPKE
jgi:hypothetical protein